VKLLIDECLHTSLVELAHAAGHVADHVNYRGLGSSKDWQLMAVIREQGYTFVTNNRSDFLALHGREPVHAGVIIIVPSVTWFREASQLYCRYMRGIKRNAAKHWSPALTWKTPGL
jgi:predicted nuclease of predicted toxin-antitoxin system